MVELAVGAGARRLVIHLLHPGDVDGDVELLLRMPFPYTARAVADTQYLFLDERPSNGCSGSTPRWPAAGCPAWPSESPAASDGSSACSAEA